MRTEPDILDPIKQWAERQENIRVVLLTSSRANPQRQPDLLSDYDIELFVRDVNPFAADDGWVFEFGAVMVRWPTTPQPTTHPDWLTQLVRTVGRILAHALGFDYPTETDDKVTAYIQWIRRLDCL